MSKPKRCDAPNLPLGEPWQVYYALFAGPKQIVEPKGGPLQLAVRQAQELLSPDDGVMMVGLIPATGDITRRQEAHSIARLIADDLEAHLCAVGSQAHVGVVANKISAREYEPHRDFPSQKDCKPLENGATRGWIIGNDLVTIPGMLTCYSHITIEPDFHELIIRNRTHRLDIDAILVEGPPGSLDSIRISSKIYLSGEEKLARDKTPEPQK